MELSKEELATLIENAQSLVKFSIESGLNHLPVVRLVDVLEKVFPQFYSKYNYTADSRVYFKCKSIEEMTPIIKYITLIGGLHQVGEKTQQGLSAEWNFGSLKINVEFSGKCKMVQTGEETITRPIMEMKCDDEAAPATQTETLADAPF